MRIRRAMSVLLALALFAVAPAAFAQKGDAAAAAKEKAGREALDRGEYDAAISALIEAHELSKKAELLYLIAKAYDAKGDDLVGSKTYYEQYMAATGGNPPELEEIQARLSVIDAELSARRAAAAAASNGKLILEIDRSGAAVEIEDKPIGTSPLTEALSYPAGSYTVRVYKEGFKEYLGVVDIEANEETRVQIALEKEGRTRWGLWTALVVGVIAGGAGATAVLLGGGGANQGVPVPGSDLGNFEF